MRKLKRLWVPCGNDGRGCYAWFNRVNNPVTPTRAEKDAFFLAQGEARERAQARAMRERKRSRSR